MLTFLRRSWPALSVSVRAPLGIFRGFHVARSDCICGLVVFDRSCDGKGNEEGGDQLAEEALHGC